MKYSSNVEIYPNNEISRHYKSTAILAVAKKKSLKIGQLSGHLFYEV
jgi:hypothetical protein